MTFKPLLAGKIPEDLSDLNFPVFASPKLDGIRCIMINGRAMTRALKPIPNDYIRNWLEANVPDGVDGELVMEDWTAEFNDLSGAVRRRTGEPDFCFAAFDMTPECVTDPFTARQRRLENVALSVTVGSKFRLVPQQLVYGVKALKALAKKHLDAGYEGTMVRSPTGVYKYGRSTTKDQILLKMKVFEDEDAYVQQVEEEMENTNVAKKNALGRTERSTHKEGKVGKGRAGRLRCVFKDGTEFHVGSGLTDALKEELWAERGLIFAEAEAGQPRIIKVKHQPPPGGRKPGVPPRIPVFLGFREETE